METFSTLLALRAGNSPVPVNSPHKGQWRGALMFTLIRVWMNGWVNNREAGDLRCQLWSLWRHRNGVQLTDGFIHLKITFVIQVTPPSFAKVSYINVFYPYQLFLSSWHFLLAGWIDNGTITQNIMNYILMKNVLDPQDTRLVSWF